MSSFDRFRPPNADDERRYPCTVCGEDPCACQEIDMEMDILLEE